jgi:surface carbohydrate biosynthesis protein
MQFVDIVYFYEHASRELDVACAVAAILEREYGLSIKIVHWPVGFPAIEDRIRTHLVVLPFCYTEDYYTLVLAKWRKALYFNVSWEQLFYSGNLKAKTPRGRFATKHLLHHAWSEMYADFLMKQGIDERDIFVNGQPAYKLYDEPYRNYFKSRTDLAAEYGLDPTRRWILFPENYNWAFYTQTKLEQFVKEGQSPAEVNAMREFCDRSFTETVLWCDEVASQENVELVIRPRPSTTLNDFQEAINRIFPDRSSRIHIIQDESVREWILASDIVVSSYSTSLIEAAIAGRAVYMLEPYPIPDPLRAEWHALLPHIRTGKEFFDACSYDTDYKTGHRLGQWARQSMMGRGDSIRRLAEYLVQLHRERAALSPAIPWKVLAPNIKDRWFTWLRLPYRRVKRLLFRHKISRVPQAYVKDVKDEAEIHTMIRKWAEFISASRQDRV